jgi:hypothetical protein
MSRTRISSTDLVALFFERLREFPDCPVGLPIAVVPSDANASGWMAITGGRYRDPIYLKRIAEIEKELRKQYVLAKDRKLVRQRTDN